jgi:FkbM family methyltransferase
MISVIDFLNESRIKSFVDAGGCTGEFTKIILEKISSVQTAVILEPIKENYLFTKDRIKDPRVEIINKALYETSKSINLGRMDDNVGGWSINHSNGNETVECLNVKDLCEKYNPDFIKIDIEGSERDILENSFDIKSIKYLEIEFHDHYIDPEDWIPYSSKLLTNHNIKYFGDSSCKQNGFFVRKDLYLN